MWCGVVWCVTSWLQPGTEKIARPQGEHNNLISCSESSHNSFVYYDLARYLSPLATHSSMSASKDLASYRKEPLVPPPINYYYHCRYQALLRNDGVEIENKRTKRLKKLVEHFVTKCVEHGTKSILLEGFQSKYLEIIPSLTAVDRKLSNLEMTNGAALYKLTASSQISIPLMCSVSYLVSFHCYCKVWFFEL